ncbi:hypothetical protein WN51_05393 [Melipona quadrifasciata]|uniref:Uncharacterized protein n=1 Tax=Melipona quadrifasciata TaxID=166423 RepID=A0A0M8ZVL0_9HYME|nr:hypothetical protein WN51_05393 [Melipona quadrifasciata]
MGNVALRHFKISATPSHNNLHITPATDHIQETEMQTDTSTNNETESPTIDSLDTSEPKKEEIKDLKTNKTRNKKPVGAPNPNEISKQYTTNTPALADLAIRNPQLSPITHYEQLQIILRQHNPTMPSRNEFLKRTPANSKRVLYLYKNRKNTNHASGGTTIAITKIPTSKPTRANQSYQSDTITINDSRRFQPQFSLGLYKNRRL